MNEDWVCVHVAANRGEAELLAGILRAEEVPVQIRGTDFTMHGPVFPEVIVPESQAKRALALLDGAAKAVVPTPGSKEGYTGGGRILWFLGGAATGAMVTLALSARMGVPQHEGSHSYDRNGDGKADVWERYSDGELVSGSYDRDFDGRVDEKTRRVGNRYETAYDYNRDGKDDGWKTCEESDCGSGRGRGRHDLDYDGKPDAWTFLRHGQVTERRWSLGRDGKIDKKAFYRHGIKTEEHFDLDRDGVFETKKRYDAFEQEKGSVP